MVLWATIHRMSRSSYSMMGIAGAVVMTSAVPIATANTGARVMMHPESDYYSTYNDQRISNPYQPKRVMFSTAQLAQLRAQGADTNLIQSSPTTPTFNPLSPDIVAPIDDDSIQYLYESTNAIRSSDEGVIFSFDRNTMLNDGNIAGNTGSLPGSDGTISTMTQREGEYNFYEMQMEWKAASTGAVDFSLTSGVTAIEANVSKQVNAGGTTDMISATHKVIAVPTIGSEVKWNISRDWTLTGTATTQSLNMGSSLVGFNAQTDWRISDRVGLSAGYQIIRSKFDLGAVTTDLNQEGLFARLSIKF